MAEAPARKLAVVLHADVAGSTLLVRQNEALAHQRIRDTFVRFAETIRRHDGVAREIRGDALLAEFSRASDAVGAALDFQESNTRYIASLEDDLCARVRIGIAMGEVVVADGTVTGEGVVLAQRLEQLAQPGGTCIQDAAYQTIPRRLPFAYESLGERVIKGFDEPVRVYCVALMSEQDTSSMHAPGTRRARETGSRRIAVVMATLAFIAIAGGTFWLQSRQPDIADPDPEATADESVSGPSIAVLPFQNLSNEEQQDYFSDGVTNDIITDLSKFSNLLVIASNSTFIYKGKAVDVTEVGRQLGVRYVLEGSVQKSANRVRINAQLIDAATNHHLWADRYDVEMGDIFKAQDEITSTVVTSLQVVLTEAEKGRGAHRLTNVTEAYDLFLRGRTYLKGTRKAHAKARELFDQAIALDPEFAAAYAEKSFSYFSSFIMPMSRNPKVIEGARIAAERAVKLDETLPLAHARMAWAYFAVREHAKAVRAARRAVALGPNDAEAHAQLGNILNWSGKPGEGRQYLERAMRLNPHHPFYYLFYLGHSHYLLEENDKAIELMNRVVTRAPYFLPVRRHLAVLYSEKGKAEQAREHTKEVLRVFPGASIEDERARCFYRWTPELASRFFTGLRKSGMPEGKKGDKPMSM